MSILGKGTLFWWMAVILYGESVEHLLLHCSFARSVWSTVCSRFNVYWVMPSPRTQSCFHRAELRLTPSVKCGRPCLLVSGGPFGLKGTIRLLRIGQFH